MMQWPPADPKLAREASSLLADVNLAFAALAQNPSSRGYMNACDMLGWLPSIALVVVPNNMQQFWEQLNDFIDALPPSCNTSVFLQHFFRRAKHDNPHEVYALVHHLYWIARWCSLGCPAMTIEGNLAASLMATETSEDAINEVMLPWDCFVVRLPRDLVEPGQLKFTHLAVHRHGSAFDVRWVDEIPDHQKERAIQFYQRKAGEVWSLYGVSDEQIALARTDAPNVLFGKERPEFLFEYLNDDHPDRGETPEDRVVQALARLVVGISYLAETPKTLRPKSTKKQPHRRWRFSKFPLTSEFVLAPDVPVKLDCTEAVGAFLRGDRKGPPRFQYIVRGHWRNQVHGPGRTGRKRIWIQPYWKGPEEAPRRLREYRFVGGEVVSTTKEPSYGSTSGP